MNYNNMLFDNLIITRHKLIINLLIVFTLLFLTTKNSFSSVICFANGIYVTGSGIIQIPVNVKLNKDEEYIIITDMSKYTSCNGNTGAPTYSMLKVASAQIHPKLVDSGYIGYLELDGVNSLLSTSAGICFWPNSTCSSVGQSKAPIPLKVKMKKASNNSAVSLSVGETIAEVVVTERVSEFEWGDYKIWKFTLSNSIIVPNYTCDLLNQDQNILLEKVSIYDIYNEGVGLYSKTTPFSFKLSCEPGTSIRVKFEGRTLLGTDALANELDPTSAIGVQILFNETPIKIGTSFLASLYAQRNEILNFSAGYLYLGGDITPQKVEAFSTVSFTYN